MSHIQDMVANGSKNTKVVNVASAQNAAKNTGIISTKPYGTTSSTTSGGNTTTTRSSNSVQTGGAPLRNDTTSKVYSTGRTNQQLSASPSRSSSSGSGSGSGGSKAAPAAQVIEQQAVDPRYTELLQRYNQLQEEFNNLGAEYEPIETEFPKTDTSAMEAAIAAQQKAYDEALAKQQAAIQAARDQSVNTLSNQRTATGNEYADLYRQLYIDKMKSQKNIDQQMVVL